MSFPWLTIQSNFGSSLSVDRTQRANKTLGLRVTVSDTCVHGPSVAHAWPCHSAEMKLQGIFDHWARGPSKVLQLAVIS